MATAVLDVELQRCPAEITGLESYRHALILIRLHGEPIGRAWLPVVSGRISGDELLEALIDRAGWPLWNRAIHHYLGTDAARSNGSSLPTVTVAVCTRDRPDDLRRCLGGILKLSGGRHEVLVVDNCPSTDATRALVKKFKGVRYVREPRPGLNVARNTALREARTDVVAFIDDDATPDPGWLRALLRNFEDPLVLCTTGLTMPLELETEAQEWFEHHTPFSRGFTRHVFNSTNLSPASAGLAGAGVNMAVRQSVLERIGQFDEALDAGTPTCSGGDNDMFSRILAAGYRIAYDPAALSWHRHRRTWRELRRATYGYGVGVYAAWTRALIVGRELPVLTAAWSWFRHSQFPALVRSLLRRPDSVPPDLILTELWGCAIGPWAYLWSRSRLRMNGNA